MVLLTMQSTLPAGLHQTSDIGACLHMLLLQTPNLLLLGFCIRIALSVHFGVLLLLIG